MADANTQASLDAEVEAIFELADSMKDCPFCGDTHPSLLSGACAFTNAEHFMAQVQCGHCGATGSRYCGEETQQLAEVKAVIAWSGDTARASTRAKLIRKIYVSVVLNGLLALAATSMFFDGRFSDVILFAICLSAAAGFIINVRAGLRDHRDAKSLRAKLDRLEPVL